MPFYQLSVIINALVASFIAVLCFFNRQPSKTEKSFAYVALCAAFWYVFEALQPLLTGWSDTAFWRISILGIIALSPAFYGFALTLAPGKRSRVLFLKIYVITALLLAAFDLTPILIKTSGPFLPLTGPAYPLVILLFFAASITGLKLIADARRKLSGAEKKEAGYLLAACAVLVTGVFISLFFWHGAGAVIVGNILAVAGLAGVYAFTKYSFTEIRLTVTRAGIFTVLYAVMLALPFWIGFTTSRWTVSVLLMGIFAGIGPLIYGLIGKKVKDILLAQQRRYQQILLEISQSMVKEHDLERLVKFIVYAVKRAVRIEFAAIFLNNYEEKAYILRAVKDPGRLHPKFFFSYTHPLVMFLKEHKRPVMFEELPETLDGFKEIDLGIRLIVPSFVEDKLVCFLLLGEKLDKTNYTEDDINIFLTLSGHAALAIENCMYLKEFEKSQEKIFNADKLASLGGMADGVAHQIKNRLNQFSVTAGEQQYEIREFLKEHKQLVDSTPDLKKTFDYLTEISVSMLDNVKKTSNVIQGVLEFARIEENGSGFSLFPVEEIIKPTVELLCVKHQINEFPMTILSGRDSFIYGVKSQVMECLYNIFDNSYEAIREKMDYHLKNRDAFKAEISLKITGGEKSSVLEITDNGIGIKEENMNKIFAPFFTTKSSFKSGAGVGMYVVKRMIEENHKGSITVESEYLKGAKVTIELPLNVKGN